MRKFLSLLALVVALAAMSGCGQYYESMQAIHKSWAENPRVARVYLEALPGKQIENLAKVDIQIPLDAGQRPKTPANPGEIVSAPIKAVTPLGLGYLVIDGFKAASGKTNNVTLNGDRGNVNLGGNQAVSQPYASGGGAEAGSGNSASGATATITTTETSTQGDGGFFGNWF